MQISMDAVFNAQQRLPASAFDGQDAIFAVPFEILRDAIAENIFPSAAVAILWRGKLVALKALGTLTYEPGSPQVTTATPFDLASVTKVVATTTMAMILYERGLLDLEAPVLAIVPEFSGPDSRRKHVTVRMLLAHSSGLPAYEKLYEHASNREELLSLAYTVNLSADPGARAEYSDIGFIILGSLLERIADESLDHFCQREIFGALGMVHTMFNPPSAL
ncbi:MAG TPA: serine hydrolase domain-containing protein, partial [Terriglobales bacterium]|nr:serine hydrolase domain-containing protein [Terriglobales bacterium]